MMTIYKKNYLYSGQTEHHTPPDFRYGNGCLLITLKQVPSGSLNYFSSYRVTCVARELKCPPQTRGFFCTSGAVAREPSDLKKKSW